ncbi:MAG: DUF4159 domain-containing protein [Phycisphaeraceae bacterium]|nr:DUF4159 domain-containing protein [Phycisphaeraceae bacterium]
MKRIWIWTLITAAALASTTAFWLHAQRRHRFGADPRGGVPEWVRDKHHPSDVFTFVRIRYSSWAGSYDRWSTDYPDSDLNFSYRLQQLTSMQVDPDGKVLEITDKELFDYPFIYMCEPGYLRFTDEEVLTLRRYLLNGGFLMVDDFWGDEEYENFHEQIKRVFPDREPVELEPGHPIFRAVFPLEEKPQVPSIGIALSGRPYGITWERGEEGREVHYKALYDDAGRMMAIICHNTDLGDGWEREGENHWYFKEFSEKRAFPMGINIVFYALTH